MHLQHLSPSREESHQARALSKGQVQRDHNREDLRNRVRALLGRGQNQGKDPLVRDPDKDRDHQARDQNLAKVLQAKDPLGRPPGKDRDHQARGQNLARVLLGRPPGKVRVNQAKDPQGNRPPNQVKDHQVKVPYSMALPSKKVDPLSKDLGSLAPNSKGHQALGLIL